MPDYEFHLWNERNCPSSPYLTRALELGNWANAANWMRLAALNDCGGIYLDTDIEVLQSLDKFLDHESFVGFEVRHLDWDGCVNNAVFGAASGHWFVRELLRRIEAEFDGSEQAHLSSPHLTTNVLKENGLGIYGRQSIRNVEVYPVEYFYPYGWHETFNPDCVTTDSHCIHWYGKSWVPKGEKEPLKRRVKARLHLMRWHLWKKRQVLAAIRATSATPQGTATSAAL
jgi:mannosyltransferase OCH1-like enzyme